MHTLRPADHRRCQVCHQAFFSDRPIQFHAVNDDAVQATLIPNHQVEGYDGLMQGGLISALHDSAMLHCLYLRRVHAMTVHLATRFHQPIQLGQAIDIQARWVKSRRSVHWLHSQITQGNTVCSTASSQFMTLPSSHHSETACGTNKKRIIMNTLSNMD
ncbi:PaaI family thioesterase [Vibrio europaeus]|uniref:PaaI family thioesterase n=1 Tax=Vibrio europaeus TaxID=300876 RepID=A0AAE7DY99_9VIBR|nr:MULTISPECIES: PaaI family thioesterase [Vibrio oreintalis group]MCG9752849.1 PaaI family thioesterase [Vibrio brasiliensis]MDC5706725.1 PaaI family thioesterase [Vibrio europaeus]MDC5711740.1 PaaI family thioesterase [Vibrio europaeus]MDC5716294.1 PaaI family thioesterase [Vibrio europaeus]MDC5725865.1 PaaI family thioesterase [Vibrio europaeus]